MRRWGRWRGRAERWAVDLMIRVANSVMVKRQCRYAIVQDVTFVAVRRQTYFDKFDGKDIAIGRSYLSHGYLLQLLIK